MKQDQIDFLTSLIKNLGSSFPECELSHEIKYLKEPETGTQVIPATDMKEFELRIKFFRGNQ